ncbi:transcription initiation factor TFIID subunit 8 [Hyalella azteca]|uniref:Transcription initiation factor TFIID subunit 8 n=1 Tax=Hyalella azteca TaxID=294128 RepID=A0A8B7PFF5_HYAAZ|nr:transcription initiation factor TFIID subunit 8 [Hyalella azteca]
MNTPTLASNGGSSPPGVSSSNETAAAHRRELSVVVACLLQEAGFVTVDKCALGTLVEILQSTLVEVGRTARGYSELAYRTQPVVADIVLAFADMGINYDGLQAYSRRVGRSVVPPSSVQQDNKSHSILQVGDKKPHFGYIPDNLPPFPDTHTYCFTPTVKQPVTEYEAIREKAATQKRDIEKALTKFGTKTNPTESLFIADDREFALICVAPSLTQNMDALMPRDQVFEAEHDCTVARARRRRLDRLHHQQQQQQLKNEQGEPEQELKAMPEITEVDIADNPYLRPVKLPRKKTSQGRLKSPDVFSPTRDSHQLGPNISRIVLNANTDPANITDPRRSFQSPSPRTDLLSPTLERFSSDVPHAELDLEYDDQPGYDEQQHDAPSPAIEDHVMHYEDESA